MFMPLNVTPLKQLKDQNAIEFTKIYYRNSLQIFVAMTNLTLNIAIFCVGLLKDYSGNDNDPEDDIPFTVGTGKSGL